MHQAAVVAHREVVAFAQERSLNGRGIGWVEVHLLAAALVAGVRLWTADARLAVVARELGIAYDVTV
jgi:predicted nucleic acid-binding protein